MNKRDREKEAIAALIDKPGRVEYLAPFSGLSGDWWFIANDGNHVILGKTFEEAIAKAREIFP